MRLVRLLLLWETCLRPSLDRNIGLPYVSCLFHNFAENNWRYLLYVWFFAEIQSTKDKYGPREPAKPGMDMATSWPLKLLLSLGLLNLYEALNLFHNFLDPSANESLNFDVVGSLVRSLSFKKSREKELWIGNCELEVIRKTAWDIFSGLWKQVSFESRGKWISEEKQDKSWWKNNSKINYNYSIRPIGLLIADSW